jgi:hypothetical protein
MRDLLSKLTTGTMIAGAALLVSACGGTETAETVDNTTVTDMNAMEPMDGTMTDNMTDVDGAMGNDAMMSNDAMANDAAMSNDAMSNDAMTNNAM